MKFEDFLKEFEDWRSKNNFPKREECREFFRNYRDSEEERKSCTWCEYILQQEKPASFLDSLFKKDGVVNSSNNNDERIKADILKEAYEYIQANNIIPSLSDLSHADSRKIFKSDEELLSALEEKYQDLQTYIFNENSFDENYYKNIIKTIKNYNRFIITTAVSNKKVNKNFLESIKNYCRKNDALLLILPCADVADRKTKIKWQLDPELRDFPIVYKDTYLNDNLMISDIKMSAKIINPTSGIQSLCREKSVIVASTKQELEPIPNFVGNHPHMLMTTGAITLGDYTSDKFMSQRTSKLAQHDHITGAVVVELEDNKIFHFRQLQADSTGNICDLGTIYTPDGKTLQDKEVCAVLGDLHIGEEDFNVLQQELNVINELDIKTAVLHDIGSMSSISHWDKNKTITQAIKSMKKTLSLEEEANNIATGLKAFQDLDSIYIVRSNHHNFLDRWLETGDYAKDPVNLYYSLDIVKAMLEGKNPFEYMIKQKTSFKDLKGKRSKFHFLKKFEEKKINGAEISLHSDKGVNGSKGNSKIFNKTFDSAVTAHTHSIRIYRGIYTVGTTSRKDLDYVDGLSTWSHSMCLINGNGSKQLINIIKNKNNEWKWRL